MYVCMLMIRLAVFCGYHYNLHYHYDGYQYQYLHIYIYIYIYIYARSTYMLKIYLSLYTHIQRDMYMLNTHTVNE